MKSIPEDVGPFSHLFVILSAANFLPYAAMAGSLTLFLYYVGRRLLLHRKVVAGFSPWSDVRREMALSALTCVIYSVVVLLTLLAAQRGWTRIYLDIDAFGWCWFFASIGITLVLHDAYFYWTHRLMHLRFLFPIMHRAHHRSTNPTPWAAYAFDPLEAFLQAGILPLVVFLYPIHPLAFVLFMAVQLGFNVVGHGGFEIFPHWFLDSWVGRFLNTPTNHAMHHRYFGSNFGLYFNFWDRLMGTNHRTYEERFRQLTSPREPTKIPADEQAKV
jgi:lathosterol oxidase